MSSAILPLLVSHILTFVESEIIKNDPEIVAYLVADLQSLIRKLETLIAVKTPGIAPVLNPFLESVSTVATNAIEAAGQAVAQP